MMTITSTSSAARSKGGHESPLMVYAFLVDTYASERLKTLNVWSMFRDDDMDVRPHARLDRDRTAHEHMVHQCQSEDRWFRTMFDIDLGTPPLPERESRLAFIQHYADDSGRRLARLRQTDDARRKAALPGPGNHPSTERPDR